MGVWRDVSKISKTKTVKVLRDKITDLRDYTNGISWKNTECILSNTNFSTKNGMYIFDSVTDKIDDNQFKAYVLGKKYEYISKNEHHLANGGSEYGGDGFINNINIDREIIGGTLTLTINMDLPSSTRYETLRGFPIETTIYINDEMLISTTVTDRRVKDTGGSKPDDTRYVYSAHVETAKSTPSVFKKILRRNPLIAILKEDLKYLKIRMEFRNKGDRDYYIPYSIVELGGGSVYSQTDVYCTYNIDVKNGDEILDTTSTAFFYEQGGRE